MPEQGAGASTAEWIETDGLGGFASGTVGLVRTRRYHALLLAATMPPGGRVVLVNGLETWVETVSGARSLTSHLYVPDVVHPDGARRIEKFDFEPWPRWIFRLEDGAAIQEERFVPHGAAVAVVTWKRVEGRGPLSIVVRPLLSGRDYHALHVENPVFNFDAVESRGVVRWHPYASLPAIAALSNGEYRHDPDWYRRFSYSEERARGLDHVEDLASPGVFRFDLALGEAILIVQAETAALASVSPPAEACLENLRNRERARRSALPSPLHRAADAYVVRRGSGKTILAGYPWFTDWGRDTFIAVRGLCIATGRFDDALAILLEWSHLVSEGMLPNRFPDYGEAPEYNSVDASLWYVIAVFDLLEAMKSRGLSVDRKHVEALTRTIDDILVGYAKGTRHGIRADADGLLAAGERGVQLTWMDAKIGDWVVTPRVGKPVEVQALWLNALAIAGRTHHRFRLLCARGMASFQERFFDAATGFLCDVVDVDHVAGTVDPTLRPNQIFAVGGLPFSLIEGDRARRIVDAVESRLVTPSGLRTLSPDHPAYMGRYSGGARERDSAYHQGTAWPWLLGPFVEAWVRVRGGTASAKSEARDRFLRPLIEHARSSGTGHIFEIADGDAPHFPRGCPFQAWSIGEALRLSLDVLR